MGNCLRNPRTALDPMLMSDEVSPVAIGQNQPLLASQEVWTAEVTLTEGQLRGKRDTFWETAPAYDGRREIWDALRAACEAVDEGEYELAQAIVDGANISLPTGRLVEAYDELGNRYVIPKYCISKPTNMAGARPPPSQRHNSAGSADKEEEEQDTDSTTNLLQGGSSSSPPLATPASGGRGRTSSQTRRRGNKKSKTSKARAPSGPPQAAPEVVPTGDPVVAKIRVSTLSKDIKMTLQPSERVRDVKRRLQTEHNVAARNITMLYSGRVLSDRAFVKNLDIPKGFVIQAIVT